MAGVAVKTYQINEVFYSLQGEGVRAGTPNVFVRFSKCNLACDIEPGPKSPGGWSCDTEFASGRKLTLTEIREWVEKCSKECKWIICTGGEPGLQVDKEFIDYFQMAGYKLAIETNGTVKLPFAIKEVDGIEVEDNLLDWITLSPKVAEHAVKQLWAHELKYVRNFGQGIPKPAATADHYIISPGFDGDRLDPETLKWCIDLVKEHPQWRLSVQQHKTTFGRIR